MTTWAAQPRNWPTANKPKPVPKTEAEYAAMFADLGREEDRAPRLPSRPLDKGPTNAERILAVMTRDGMTSRQIADAANLHYTSVTSTLPHMRKRGEVEVDGTSRRFFWRLP